MQTIAEMALLKANQGVFTREQAAVWIGDRGERLNALLKRAVASGEVWRIYRGLFCLSDRYTLSKINPLGLAQRIHGPSYISLETALSYHGWIPEAVQAVTSVCTARSRSFETPVGLFSFIRVPQQKFYAGVRRISADNGSIFFLATSLKALADTIYVQKLDWHSMTPVVESFRVDERSLAKLTSGHFDEILPAYKPGRVRRFLAGFRRDLKL